MKQFRFLTVTWQISMNNATRPFKTNCLFCIKMNYNLYAQGRKTENDIKKTHSVKLILVHITVPLEAIGKATSYPI